MCYTGKQTADFYIQNKGYNSGKPHRAPLRNCFAVFTEDEFLFQKVQALFIGRYFEPFIHGSVVPTIRLDDVKKIIERTPIKMDDKAIKQFKSLDDIDKLIIVTQEKIKMLKNLKTAIATETVRR